MSFFWLIVLFSLLFTNAFSFSSQNKKPWYGMLQPLCSQPPTKVPLAEQYPEFLEILRVLDPVGTASLPKKKFLTDEWKTDNEVIGADLFGYGLIYEFAREVAEEEKVKNDHETYCTHFSKHLLRSFDVPLTIMGSGVDNQELLSGRGKVLLFASLDKLALRSEILGFISNDPYVKLGYLSNWMLLERTEIIKYIKDWYVLQFSYKKLVGEVERLDRQEIKRKPWIPSQNKFRRHMNDNNGNFYNSGIDVDEYDSATDEGYDYKYGKQKRENEVKKEKRK